MPRHSRRDFLGTAATTVAALSLPRSVLSANGPDDAIQAEIEKRHAEGVQRLQEWVRQPSIAAENRGMTEGCELMMKLARDAGFQTVSKVPTDGQPGVFATLDLMTGGRAAWNVVTSLNDGEAQNMGRDEVVAHDERYDRADEFIIDRAKPRQHLAFGAGIHRCVGDRLAEQQIRILWEEILNRDLRFEITCPPQRLYSNFIRGIRSMPVRIVS